MQIATINKLINTVSSNSTILVIRKKTAIQQNEIKIFF